ncbi:hypothetical protein ACFZAC_26175 [Pseudomonas fluorescens]|uniref:hypothetical protein n=1 Tax=Pseudomonas fluorescens TaxID=294 RepID=UPI00374A27AF
MASKIKVAPEYEPLVTIQAGMEALAAQSVMDAVGLKNTIKRQPLCVEGVSSLECVERAAHGMLRLAAAYREELKALANEGRHHAA